MADDALLDTHAFIWFSVAPEALSEPLPIIPGDEVSGRMPGVEMFWRRFTGVATHRTPDRTLGAELRKRTLPDRRRPDPRAGTHARMYYIGS